MIFQVFVIVYVNNKPNCCVNADVLVPIKMEALMIAIISILSIVTYKKN